MTDNYLAVVTENAPGGPLHRHILHKGRLPEDEACRYFRQLLTALAHCHGQVRDAFGGIPVRFMQTRWGSRGGRGAPLIPAAADGPCTLHTGMAGTAATLRSLSDPCLLQMLTAIGQVQPSGLGALPCKARKQTVMAAKPTPNIRSCRVCASGAHCVCSSIKSADFIVAGRELMSFILFLPQGVYHRDLQLGALRFDACGSIVLTDFGYCGAKLASSGEAADVSDRAASPAYTPPEVLLGHSIVNANYDGEILGGWLADHGWHASLHPATPVK